MASIIDAPAKCELRSVSRFLQAERTVQQKFTEDYDENFLSDGAVRERCRKFKYGRIDAHDEDGQVSKSVATEDLDQSVPRSFWNSLNGTSLITRRVAPT
ncbi:hypothetical protein AVEN_225728-1 [Araneus ventricosus]|uniref:Uncharacterized protein n=1 Tax=Araneus ventricosus TaxID=182803 RepID=A0A4Y2QL70_ARAVE|nr:hypothetical protein AVEN_225728-1 [Araneus ventricosus]